MQQLNLRLEAGGRVAPGGSLHGAFSWRLNSEVRAIALQLWWCSERRQDGDCTLVRQLVVQDPGLMGQHDFSFDTPCGPCSYQGHLFSIAWHLELFTEPKTEVVVGDVVVAPEGEPLRPGLASEPLPLSALFKLRDR